jgi:hypothetical protein
LTAINSLASIEVDFDIDSGVSDDFCNISEKIVQLPRESWKIDPSNDIQMEAFTKFSEVDLSILEPKSDDEITLFCRLDKVEFVVDMLEEEELKGYWETVNRPYRQL